MTAFGYHTASWLSEHIDKFSGKDLSGELKGVVKNGQTASSLLNSYIGLAEIYKMGESCEEVHPLSRLKAGNPFSVVVIDGCLEEFRYEIDREEILSVKRNARGFAAQKEKIKYDVEVERVEGTITHSLFGALDTAGEGPQLAIDMADIFAWEIDFFRDLRVGDSFVILVEKQFRDGEFAGYGRIQAAQFVNKGLKHQGYLYHDADGRPCYYDAQGQNLKKAFLKAPLSFSRISSGFSMSRLHPVLKVRRPHPAIDYAAPAGTPVMAVGDGTVIKAHYSKSAGRMVTLRHPNGYETNYLHLSRFGDGIKVGEPVFQGQVIGYVGSTGLSTGPHLDFRMKKNGQWVNPNDIDVARAEPLPEDLKPGFNLLMIYRNAMLKGFFLTDTQEAVNGGS